MELGKAIAELRGRRGLSQKDLATALDISTTYVSLIENDRRMPTVGMLERLSVVLGVPLPVLFFLALSESDIPTAKREAYKILVPSLRGAIMNFFSAAHEPNQVAKIAGSDPEIPI